MRAFKENGVRCAVKMALGELLSASGVRLFSTSQANIVEPLTSDGEQCSVDIAKVVAKYLPNGQAVCKTNRENSGNAKLSCVSGCSEQSVNDAVKVIEERQVFHRISNVFAIEASRCKYGFPRAYVVSLIIIFEFSHEIQSV